MFLQTRVRSAPTELHSFPRKSQSANMSDGSQSSEVVPSQEKKDAEIDTGLIEKDGAIGFYKNRTFQALTNFSIACKGFVSNGSMVELS